MIPSTRRCLSFTIACSTALLAHNAAAEPALIENPGDHPPYHLELEPHGLIGFGALDNGALGAGLRATIKLMDPGFVPSINNTVGVSFGADAFLGAGTTLLVPLEAQWNFFFTQHWSMMLEGGLGLAINDRIYLSPAFSIGGRYHIVERVALTVRIGYPALSVGVSFFL
jgi:hypothetical protein